MMPSSSPLVSPFAALVVRLVPPYTSVLVDHIAMSLLLHTLPAALDLCTGRVLIVYSVGGIV